MYSEETICDGCKYDKRNDISICLEKCSHCLRAYSLEEDKSINDDLYEKEN